MPRLTKRDREIQREAYRIFTPLMFWMMAYTFYQLLEGFFVITPWTKYVAWGFVAVLTIAGICYIPRAVRTIRGL